MSNQSRVKKQIKTGKKSVGEEKTSAKRTSTPRTRPLVGIVMGSDSDLRIMSAAETCLTDFEVSCEVRIISAHRTPTEMLSYAAEAEKRGLKILIAGAGGAAHLPGMLASATILPVIGVPVNITALDGIDAFLSIAQMPKGIPVATVAIDNATNAALLAIRILATTDPKLAAALHDFQERQSEKVRATDKSLKSRKRKSVR